MNEENKKYNLMNLPSKQIILQTLFLTIILSFNCQSLYAQTTTKRNFVYKNTPLENVLEEWKENNDISFSYDYDLIKKYKVSGDFSDLSIKDMLVKLLRNTKLEFKGISDNNFVLKKLSEGFYDPYKYKICGNILDNETLEPLTYTNIYIKGTKIGVASDLKGNFLLNEPFTPNDTIAVSYLGYKTKYINIDNFTINKCKEIKLKIKPNNIDEIIITDRLFYNVENNTFLSTENVSSTTFNMEEIGEVISFGEKDIFQITQILPSVSATDESASQIHIRGGNSGQTLILYDNIPLYHNGHFFGKISSINPNAIEKVSVSKEGFSSSYGSRVSGVIDIKGKQEIPVKKSLKIEGNLLSGNANLEFPLAKNKFAVFVNYRHSLSKYFSDNPYQNFFDQVFQNSVITEDIEYIKNSGIGSTTTNIPTTSFYDLNTKLLWHPSINDNISISYLNTKDIMKYFYDENNEYFEESVLKVKNSGLNMNWNHKWNKGINSNASFSISNYDNYFLFKDNLNIDSAKIVHENTNRLNDYSFMLSNSILKGEQYISFGYQLNRIGEKAYILKRDESFKDEIFNDDTVGFTNTIFTDYRLDLDRIDFNFGMRFNHYNLTNKLYFEPRFIVKVYPVKNFSFKLAGGIYHQAINQIVEFNKLNVEDHLWLLSRKIGGRDLYSVVKNTQYSMGIDLKILNWNFDLTFYDRFYKGITSRTLRFDTKDFPFYSGNMSSRGIELSIQKKSKYYYTYIGYTLNDVKYEFEYPEYPVTASYNQKHLLDILLGFNYKNYNFSTSFKFGSGLPYTEVDSIGTDFSDPNNPGYWVEYQSFNNKSLIPYYRVDLGLSRKFIFNNYNGKITVSAINIMNRKNYLKRFYKLKYINDTDKPALIKTDRIGLPLSINVGVIFEINCVRDRVSL